MNYNFTMNLDGESPDDIIGQVEDALRELKEEVAKTDGEENLTGTGWDLEWIED